MSEDPTPARPETAAPEGHASAKTAAQAVHVPGKRAETRSRQTHI